MKNPRPAVYPGSDELNNPIELRPRYSFDATLKLSDWAKARRVVLEHAESPGQHRLSFATVADGGEVFEHAALVTSLGEPILGLDQLHRDRADCENVFDELKNQWGHVEDMLPAWGGFTTHDLGRCRLADRLVALVYNWWNCSPAWPSRSSTWRRSPAGLCS
jgi:hypothetical protein